MATSGYLTQSMGAYYTFYIYWEVISTSEADGTYKLYISHGVRKKAANASTYNLDSHLWASYGATTLLEGAEVAWDMRSASVGAEWSLYNTTRTISCNEDGTRELYLYGYFDPGNVSGASAAEISGYVTLPTIYRATAPVLSASSADMGTKITIDLTGAKSSAFTHKLTYKLPDGTTGTIATGLGAVSYSWTVTDFASKIPNATSGVMEIICTTYNASGTSIGSKTVSLTATVPDSVKPTIEDVSVTEAVSGLAAQFGAFIQSKSKLKVTITAAGAKGSTVKSVSSVFNGATYSGTSWTSGYVNGSGKVSLAVTVTDSRGRSTKITYVINVLAYTKPSITAFRAWRVTSAGAADDAGDYVALKYAYSVPSLNGGNTAAMAVKAKLSTATSYDTTLTSGSSLSQTVSSYIAATTLSSANRWDLEITVADWFGAVTTAIFPLPSAETILEIRADGEGITAGSTADETGLCTVWPVKLLEPVGSYYVNGRKYARLIQSSYQKDTYYPFASVKTAGGSWELGAYTNNRFLINYVPDEAYEEGSSATDLVKVGAFTADGSFWPAGGIYPATPLGVAYGGLGNADTGYGLRNIGAQAVGYRIPIPKGADLDDYTIPGSYASASYSNTVTNDPRGTGAGGFILDVIATTGQKITGLGNYQYMRQVLRYLKDNTVWQRFIETGANATEYTFGGWIRENGPWDLIGAWGYGGSLTADFTKYRTIVFVYDRQGDGTFNGAPTIVVPKNILSSDTIYVGAQYSSSIRFVVQMNNASAKTYSAISGGETCTTYKIYCYGR